MLYRAFPMLPGAEPGDPGGPLYVPRHIQGANRHDNPREYGAIYASRTARSAVAEWLRRLRGGPLVGRDLQRPDGARMALAALDDAPVTGLVDLDDPRNLVARELRPSGVATRDRRRTRRLALGIFEEGGDGFEWWSTIEASWINVTLFAERALQRLTLAAEPEPLALDQPAVRDAAAALGVRIEG